MKIKLAILVLLCITLHAFAQVRPGKNPDRNMKASSRQKAAADNHPGQSLPIRRVILYSNGVAYIERRGKVSGRAEINLSFKQSEVDDVLKSMVVLDLGQGRIGAVSYNSSAPPSARMAEIPFAIEPETRGGARGGLAGVLGQMQGARVLISTARGTSTGSILTVEEKKSQVKADNQPVNAYAIVIVGSDGELMSYDLSEVRSVKLLDDGTKRDVGEFAGASASARRRDAKTITVTSDGERTREMLISYTVAAPIWKTTYRVVLDAEEKPFFQGWAIVDNVSEEDWNSVELSLISGTPVSFIRPMQKPFYRYRPVVPMPKDLRLMPQVYEPSEGDAGGGSNVITGKVFDPQGAVIPNARVTARNNATGQQFTLATDSEGQFRTQLLPAGTYTLSINAAGFRQFIFEGVRVNPVRPAVLSATLEVGSVSETVSVAASESNEIRANSVNNLTLLPSAVDGRSSAETMLGEALAGGSSGIETAAEGSEVGDLFEYKIDRPVTIRRDRSALIPILQTRLDGERVSIYNQSSGRIRPLSGLLLKNVSRLTLEDGALTVIDGNAYAGEALLERLKPAEQRLISFALDLGTLINVREEEDRGPVFSVRIVNGSMMSSFYNKTKKIYKLTNQTDRPRTVYVEHPVRDNWELDERETVKPEGRSGKYYRFRVALAPHTTAELSVTEREALSETYALTNISPEQLQLFVTRRYVDDSTRETLQRILELKGRVAQSDTQIVAFDKELKEISEDQKRLRDNIEALTKTAEARQLISRYVAKADQQESRIEELTKSKQIAVDERQKVQNQLESVLRNLTYKRDL